MRTIAATAAAAVVAALHPSFAQYLTFGAVVNFTTLGAGYISLRIFTLTYIAITGGVIAAKRPIVETVIGGR